MEEEDRNVAVVARVAHPDTVRVGQNEIQKSGRPERLVRLTTSGTVEEGGNALALFQCGIAVRVTGDLDHLVSFDRRLTRLDHRLDLELGLADKPTRVLPVEALSGELVVGTHVDLDDEIRRDLVGLFQKFRETLLDLVGLGGLAHLPQSFDASCQIVRVTHDEILLFAYLLSAVARFEYRYWWKTESVFILILIMTRS